MHLRRSPQRSARSPTLPPSRPDEWLIIRRREPRSAACLIIERRLQSPPEISPNAVVEYIDGDQSSCAAQLIKPPHPSGDVAYFVAINAVQNGGALRIADTLEEIFHRADADGATTAFIADRMAEAVEDATVMRYSRAATERLTEASPAVARLLRDMTLKSLAAAQGRLMILGRMMATERVASFLLELSERNDDDRHVELPMCRCDIGDYLGITIETVCRVLSDLRRRGVIEVSPHSITLLDRFALEAIGED